MTEQIEEFTTIAISKDVREQLFRIKLNSTDTYNSVILRLLDPSASSTRVSKDETPKW